MQAVTTIGLSPPNRCFRSWHRPGRPSDHPPSAEAALRRSIFREAATVSSRDRGLRCVASLVTPTPGSGAYGTSDAAGLREALCEAAEERCCRR